MILIQYNDVLELFPFFCFLTAAYLDVTELNQNCGIEKGFGDRIVTDIFWVPTRLEALSRVRT